MIKRIALCFAVAVLAFALSGCGTEPSESDPVTVTYWAKKIAYAYREKEADTGRFGDVLGMAGSCAVGAYVVWEAMRTSEDEEEDEEDVVFCDRH